MHCGNQIDRKAYFKMAMADVKNSRCKKRVEDLPMDVLNTLSMHLNPKMVCGGDWTTLAGKFEMKYIEIKNFEREQNPTLAVLHKWWSETGDKTVSHLIDIFEEMKRNDVVKLLKPYEFYGMKFDIFHFLILGETCLFSC